MEESVGGGSAEVERIPSFVTATTPVMAISPYLAFRLVWDFICLDSNC